MIVTNLEKRSTQSKPTDQTYKEGSYTGGKCEVSKINSAISSFLLPRRLLE
jgi:hypothetical protein